MIDDKVHDQFHVPLLQLGDERVDIIQGPVRRVDGFVVGLNGLAVRLKSNMRWWAGLTMSYPMST
jgi:hypothetical protein